MYRKSARIKRLRDDKPAVTQSLIEGQVDAAYADADASESDTGVHRSKKIQAKLTTRTRVRRAGKLRQMLDMPLDVILEICVLLHPMDVLNLSRASKDLRKFFMSRNSMPIWKATMSSLPGLPPCPDDLSEPAYVNLMLSHHCHVCLRKNCQEAYWLLRLRLCDACRKKLEIPYWEVNPDIREFIRPYQLPELVPPIRYLYNSAKYPRFFIPAIEEFVEDLQKTPKAGRDEFLRSRQEHLEHLRENSVALVRYFWDSKMSRSQEIETQRTARRNQITERLKQAGYEEEVKYLFDESSEELDRWEARRKFCKLPEVRKTQVLTTRIWNNIQERIFRFMDDVREERLRPLRRVILIERLKALKKCIDTLAPSLKPRQLSVLEAAYKIPEVIAILNPRSEEFDAHDLEQVLNEIIPTYLEHRGAHRRQALGNYIREKLELDASVDPFTLAVAAVFYCSSCNSDLTLTHTLDHCCIHSHREVITKPEDMSDDYWSVLTEWAESKVLANPDWSKYFFGITITSGVIEDCGLDPKTASVNDMNGIDVRFLCLRHHYFSPVMDWRATIHHSCRVPHCRRKANEAELSAVKPLEIALERERTNPSTYRCGHCSSVRNMTEEEVGNHLKEAHNITEPKEDDCIGLIDKLPPPVEAYFFLPEMKGNTSFTMIEKALQKGIAIYYDYSNVEENSKVS